MPKIVLTVLLGLGTVAVSLIILIGVIRLLHIIISAAEKGRTSRKGIAPPAPAVPGLGSPEIDRGTLVALISAAVAEQLGGDVSAIRIVSIKKI